MSEPQPGPATRGPATPETAHPASADSVATRSVATRLFAILDAFSTPTAVASLGLTTIARRAGLPLSTTHRLVAEWVKWGGLTRLDDGRYTLGLRLWEIGVQAPTARNLRTIALPYLEDLFEVTREHVHLAILDGGEALYVEKLSGHRSVNIISRVGGRLPLHSTGVGLVLLAYAQNDVIDDYVSRPLEQFLPQTVTSADDLRRRLAGIRAQGFAVMSEEMTEGSSSLAAPVRDRTGHVVAAVSIVTRTAAATATGGADDVTQSVRQAAQGISRAMGYRRAV